LRILLIEDDTSLGRAVRDHLIAQNQAVDWVETREDAHAAYQGVLYDFVLLDLRLPDGNGLEFLQSLRDAKDATPVIILTAHDQVSDRIAGLNHGADDYLVKPFDLRELSARMLAVTRRLSGQAKSEIILGNMVVDMENKRVFIEGGEVGLSGREWTILEYMARRPSMLVSKGQIEEAIYAFGSEIESNAVEVYVSRLRKKIGRDKIKTHHGRGYSLC